MPYPYNHNRKKNPLPNPLRTFNRALLATLIIGFLISLLPKAKAELISDQLTSQFSSTQDYLFELEHPYYQDIQNFTTRRWHYFRIAKIQANQEKCSNFIQQGIKDYHSKGLKTEILHLDSDHVQVKLCEKDRSILAICTDNAMLMEKIPDCH